MDSDLPYDAPAAGYDPEAVRFFDVAHEGAQIRAIAEAASDQGILSTLRGIQPRSVVVVAPASEAQACARLACALRSPLRVPVVISDVLPAYVGALDVVVVLCDAADDPEVAHAALSADRRGATVVIAGPARGPIVEDSPERALTIPALPTTASFSPLRALVTVVSVLDLLEDAEHLCTDCLLKTAECVDEELSSLAPDKDVSVNPARQLREQLEGARIVHTGVDHLTQTVAHVASQLLTAAGLTGGTVDQEVLPALWAREPSSQQSIFHDPFLDGPDSLLPLKVIVWGVDTTSAPNAYAVRVDGASRSAATLDDAARLLVRALAAGVYTLPQND